MTSFQDPEMSYRRGCHDGALELFQAIQHLLPASERERLRASIQREIGSWRIDDPVGKTSERTSESQIHSLLGAQ
jgi:hypothetical protein